MNEIKSSTAAKHCSLIRAKFGGELYQTGRRFKPGEIVVMLARTSFQDKGADGKKNFRNQYVYPWDMKDYPELDEARAKLEAVYGDLGRFKPRVEWRR